MHRIDRLLLRPIHVNCNESNTGINLPSYAITNFAMAYEGILLRLLVFSLFYINNQRDATWQYVLVTAVMLYMFRTLFASILRST